MVMISFTFGVKHLRAARRGRKVARMQYPPLAVVPLTEDYSSEFKVSPKRGPLRFNQGGLGPEASDSSASAKSP